MSNLTSEWYVEPKPLVAASAPQDDYLEPRNIDERLIQLHATYRVNLYGGYLLILSCIFGLCLLVVSSATVEPFQQWLWIGALAALADVGYHRLTRAVFPRELHSPEISQLRDALKDAPRVHANLDELLFYQAGRLLPEQAVQLQRLRTELHAHRWQTI